MINRKWDATVTKINGVEIGTTAHVSCDGFLVANVTAGAMFGDEKSIRDQALKNAQHIAWLHNASLKG